MRLSYELALVNVEDRALGQRRLANEMKNISARHPITILKQEISRRDEACYWYIPED